jgi:hypothetical protein
VSSIPVHGKGVLHTTSCGNVFQWLATGLWFSSGTPVSSTNKFDHHDIAEIDHDGPGKYKEHMKQIIILLNDCKKTN